MTHITSPAEVDEILRSTDIAADLHNRDSFPLLGGSVLTLTRTEHLQRRRLEARLFARDALHISEQSVLLPAVKRRLARAPHCGRTPSTRWATTSWCSHGWCSSR